MLNTLTTQFMIDMVLMGRIPEHPSLTKEEIYDCLSLLEETDPSEENEEIKNLALRLESQYHKIVFPFVSKELHTVKVEENICIFLDSVKKKSLRFATEDDIRFCIYRNHPSLPVVVRHTYIESTKEHLYEATTKAKIQLLFLMRKACHRSFYERETLIGQPMIQMSTQVSLSPEYKEEIIKQIRRHLKMSPEVVYY